MSMPDRHRRARRLKAQGRTAVLACLSLAVAGCGGSEFSARMMEICQRPDASGAPANRLLGFGDKDCGCVIATLESGLTARQQASFIPLRYELMPDPADRERVNGEMLRAAGIDPTDRRAVRSARSELNDALHPLSRRIREQCPSAG
jgi:hypothetical protein